MLRHGQILHTIIGVVAVSALHLAAPDRADAQLLKGLKERARSAAVGRIADRVTEALAERMKEGQTGGDPSTAVPGAPAPGAADSPLTLDQVARWEKVMEALRSRSGGTDPAALASGGEGAGDSATTRMLRDGGMSGPEFARIYQALAAALALVEEMDRGTPASPPDPASARNLELVRAHRTEIAAALGRGAAAH